jgi:uncharacterized RDD family membrane protein YckC
VSEGTPKDPGHRPMPWEPQAPQGGAPEPAPPPDSGWTPPEPTDPTTAWTPPQSAASVPPTPTPWQPAPSEPGGLISSAPVGWSAPPPDAAEVAPGLTFADTTSRVVAFIIDSIILFFGITIIAAILGLVAATTVTDTSVSARVGGPIGSIVYALLGLAYFVGSWTGGRRATIGQRVMNIQVGNAFDGRALSLEQAVRRWLALGAWIGILGVVPSLVSLSGLIELLWVVILLITTATSPTKQGLHDRFANTALVRPTGQGTSGLAMACIVIVIVLLLLAVISFVALIFLGGQVSDILSRVGDSI